MKYIRTKDENNLILCLSTMVIPYQIIDNVIDFNRLGRFEILKQADTIEELCDEFVAIHKTWKDTYVIQKMPFVERNESFNIYGAIWTDKGLIYVAKMNEKGELELL